jgi:hypothetical protein
VKYDPVNELYYDATPEEMANWKGGHSGLSLPGSVATRLKNREKQHPKSIAYISEDEE